MVTGTSGAATSGAEQINNRKGKTCNPCDYGRSLCGPAFLSPPDDIDEDAGVGFPVDGIVRDKILGMKRKYLFEYRPVA